MKIKFTNSVRGCSGSCWSLADVSDFRFAKIWNKNWKLFLLQQNSRLCRFSSIWSFQREYNQDNRFWKSLQITNFILGRNRVSDLPKWQIFYYWKSLRYWTTVKLGYNELGNNVLPLIANKFKGLVWFRLFLAWIFLVMKQDVAGW